MTDSFDVIDLETDLIDEDNPFPTIYAAGTFGHLTLVEDAFCTRLDYDDPLGRSIWIVTPHSASWRGFIEQVARPQRTVINQALEDFDLPVIAHHHPDLWRPMLESAYQGRYMSIDRIVRLIDIATTGRYRKEKYSLANISKWFGLEDFVGDKEGETRTSYARIEGVPIRDWPYEYVEYLARDVVSPAAVFNSVTATAQIDEEARRQAWYYLALARLREVGMPTDPVTYKHYLTTVKDKIDSAKSMLAATDDVDERIDRLLTWYEKNEGELYDAEKAAFRDRIRRTQIFESGVLNRNGSRSEKTMRLYLAEAWRDSEESPIKTPPSISFPNGQLSLSEEAVEAVKDPLAAAYLTADTRSWRKAQELSAAERNARVRTRFGMTVTTRTISSDKPMQNRPRNSPGDRETIAAAPGKVIISLDVAGLEVATLGQTCKWMFGQSALLDALNRGVDLHANLGKDLPHLNISLEEFATRYATGESVIGKARQLGKIGNFSIAGGSGEDTLIKQAWSKFRVRMTHQEARALIDTWRMTWPQARQMQLFVSNRTGHGGSALFTSLPTNKVKRCRYTEGCNYLFSVLGADFTKDCTSMIVYDTQVNPLMKDVEPFMYIHDEWLVHAPYELADQVAERLQQIVIDTGKRWLPDVTNLKADPVVSARWSKEAHATTDSSGATIPWEWPVSAKLHLDEVTKPSDKGIKNDYRTALSHKPSTDELAQANYDLTNFIGDTPIMEVDWPDEAKYIASWTAQARINPAIMSM